MGITSTCCVVESVADMTRFDGAAMEYVVQRWLVGSRFVSTVRIRVHVAVVVLESEKRERNNILTKFVSKGPKSPRSYPSIRQYPHPTERPILDVQWHSQCFVNNTPHSRSRMNVDYICSTLNRSAFAPELTCEDFIQVDARCLRPVPPDIDWAVRQLVLAVSGEIIFFIL